MERCVGTSWEEEDDRFEGKAVCTELFTKELASLEKRGLLSPKQCGAARAAAAGAVMTMSKAVDGEYMVSNRCPLCGVQDDTVHHRVYSGRRFAGTSTRATSFG